MYRPGELDQRIKILRPQYASDGLGGRTETDVATVFETWAQVKPSSGDERFNADRVNAEAIYDITIRWRDDFFENDTMEWNGLKFNIKFIPQRGQRMHYITFKVERGVAL